MLNVELIPISLLKPNRRNARTHSAKQIRQIANSIAAFGFLVPVLIDDDQTIVAGHGRWAAAKLLQLPEIPVLKVTGLSAPQKRALALADNKIAENAGWDRQILAAADLPACVALVPRAVELLGRPPELHNEIAREVLWLGLATLLAPQAHQSGFIIAHDDPGV